MNKPKETDVLSQDQIVALHKELELIQNNIKRMASNSFLIKGWAVTLVIGSLLLRVTDLQLILPFIPIISFWCLDTYFLYIERKFRDLYNWVVDNRYDSQEYLFNMKIDRFKKDTFWKKRKEILCTFVSKKLALFYLPTLLVVILYVVFSIIS